MEHDNLNEVLLEKLKVYSQKPNDCIEGVRSVAARLHSRAASQGNPLLSVQKYKMSRAKYCFFNSL